jgi:hypothetical protein
VILSRWPFHLVSGNATFVSCLKPLVHSKLGGKTLFAGGYFAYLHGYSFMGFLCSSKIFGFFGQTVGLLVLLKNKGYPLTSLKWMGVCFNREKFLFGISAFGVFHLVLYRL